MSWYTCYLPFLFYFSQKSHCKLYNATADKCKTKTGQCIQINKCSLRDWLKVKKRGVLSRRFIAPIRNYAWIRCFFCVQSKQPKLCAVVKLQLWEPEGYISCTAYTWKSNNKDLNSKSRTTIKHTSIYKKLVKNENQSSPWYTQSMETMIMWK